MMEVNKAFIGPSQPVGGNMHEIPGAYSRSLFARWTPCQSNHSNDHRLKSEQTSSVASDLPL